MLHSNSVYYIIYAMNVDKFQTERFYEVLVQQRVCEAKTLRVRLNEYIGFRSEIKLFFFFLFLITTRKLYLEIF